MKAFVYILFYEKLNRYYRGITTLVVEEKLKSCYFYQFNDLNF
ncbi:hypothetical protein [Arthrospiribacter ruber]|nr:hypothetical protein [Arthrospiribacter ruber]